METYSANNSNIKIESYQSPENAETDLFVNDNNISNARTQKKDVYSVNNFNENQNKRISIPNLNLNKSNYSNLYGNETNLNDFLGKKRQNGNLNGLYFNGISNSNELNRGEFQEARNEYFNPDDIFHYQAANKNSNFSDNEKNYNNKIKINSAIKKIGAKIIRASPTDSPKFNKRIDFSQEKKIIFEMNESENSLRSNESKLTEALEAHNNYNNNNNCNEENEDELNININNNSNNEGDEYLNKFESNQSNQVDLNLHENEQGEEHSQKRHENSFPQEKDDIEIIQDLPAEEIILDINPNNFTFKNPANYQSTEVRQRNIPDSAQNNFQFTEYTNDNLQPNIQLNNICNENHFTQQQSNKTKQSDKKLFSNQNLNFTNPNQINNATEDFIFEKPLNVYSNPKANNQIKNNNIKFSNTQIPEVFDEVYIQRRINKAEINSPNAELKDNYNTKLNCRANQTFNPLQRFTSSNGTKSSNNFLTQTLNSLKINKWPEFSWADLPKFLGPLALIGLGCFLYTFHKEDIKKAFTDIDLNKLNLTNHTKDLLILLISIAIVSTMIYYLKKYYDDQRKTVNDSAKEMQDYILSILEFSNEEGLRYPDIDVEDFSNHYAKEKNISQSLMKKILNKLDKTFEDKNSEIIKITLYLDGKMKSFWKLRMDCI